MRTGYCASRIVLLALLMVLPGCGGGGGAAPAPLLTPPVISGLSFPPAVSHTNIPSMLIVDGSVNFVDAGGDVTQLDLFIYDGTGTLLITSSSTPVLLTTSGVTSGTLGFSLNVETTFPVSYIFQVVVVDSGGSQSNALSGTFDVI